MAVHFSLRISALEQMSRQSRLSSAARLRQAGVKDGDWHTHPPSRKSVKYSACVPNLSFVFQLTPLAFASAPGNNLNPGSVAKDGADENERSGAVESAFSR